MIRLIAFSALLPGASGILISGGTVYDGSGGKPFKADVHISGDHIDAIGHLRPQPGDQVIDATGLAVAPGFIDAHSHADEGVFEDPDCETHIRQGITTSVVGEDGGSALPVSDFFGKLESSPIALNFASFVGMGTVRARVLGMAQRAPTGEELEKMRGFVAEAMKQGALGLSTGLEYEPNRYAKTDEVIELAKVSRQAKGIYISHMRNEDNHVFEAANELITISEKAGIPAEINHIKLGSHSVWGKAPDLIQMMRKHRIWADVYPYLFWQSTIRVLIETEQFSDRKQWEKGLSDIGGPSHVLLSTYEPDPSWAGHTLAEISATTGKDAVTLCQEIVAKTTGADEKRPRESVVVTAMDEGDLKAFVADPNISFCSDGGLHGTHPRGAGAFPRVLGVYVREQHVIPLQEAIRKMTRLPAERFGLKDRGRLVAGNKADITLFDPNTVIDKATTKDPQAAPVGIPTVIVNGVPVLLNGKFTGAHPGRPLRRR